jgi:phage protein U
MFALLGDIPFQVVGSPQSLSDARRYDYAEHRVIQALPQLQWLANDLMTMHLEVLLHQAVNSPAVNLLALTEAAAAHQALPLIFGNGELKGYFVISAIDTLSRQLTGTGDIISMTVRIELLESPTSFDPAAAPIPTFIPLALGIASGTDSTTAAATVAGGLSALAALASPSGATRPMLLPDDVPSSVIVRSAS